MFKIYKYNKLFRQPLSQSRISLVEEKNSWSSTASSKATKREKVVTEMFSIHMLSSSKSALVAKNLGNYTAATSILAWAFLCPPPLWSIVPCVNLRRSQAFIYLNAEVRMDIKCICEDVDSKHRFDSDGGKWCCSNNCKVLKKKKYYRWAESVSCKGTALNLTQQCNSSCNFYQKDTWRSPRSYLDVCEDFR